MTIFEFSADHIREIAQTTFEQAGFSERGDLQRLLKAQFEVIEPDVLIISEEFSAWEDSRRRIDLLGLDKNANLVVVELKRTDDGGHMELQSIRYAAMISAMTFDQAKAIYGEYLQRQASALDASTSILDFLGWDEPDENSFAQDVRIVLVSANFSKEITTSVLWLNDRGLDIRCVRLRPHLYGERLLVDVQQIVPLPEAEDFTVNLRKKSELERIDRGTSGSTRHQLRLEFWQGLLERAKGKTSLFDGVSAKQDNWIGTGAGIARAQFQFVIRKYDSELQFVLMGEKEWNKAAFDTLYQHKTAVESSFGEPIEWMRKDTFISSYLRYRMALGGIFSEKDQWPAIQDRMIERMIAFEKAVSPFITSMPKKYHDNSLIR